MGTKSLVSVTFFGAEYMSITCGNGGELSRCRVRQILCRTAELKGVVERGLLESAQSALLQAT